LILFSALSIIKLWSIGRVVRPVPEAWIIWIPSRRFSLVLFILIIIPLIIKPVESVDIVERYRQNL
jgi:hypothetical protein